MAYAGETARIISRAKDFHQEPITDQTPGITVTVDVHDAEGTPVVDGEAMSWDATGNADGPYWYFDWDTSGRDPGGYRTKVTYTGGGLNAEKFGRVRLARPPF